jgi:large subunit ribosomal protein L4
MSVQTVSLYDLEGKEIEKVSLDPEVFDGELNIDLLHQIKLMYEANFRRGNASTKTRGQVRGGGRKPWAQKGTGRARMGSIRSPLWPGGGKTFGPQPRDYYYRLPRRMVRLALKNCLNMKFKDSALKLIQEINLEKPKTRLMATILKNLKVADKALLVVKNKDGNLALASRNISSLTIKNAAETNAWDILNNQELLLTKPALEELILRIKR